MEDSVVEDDDAAWGVGSCCMEHPLSWLPAANEQLHQANVAAAAAAHAELPQQHALTPWLRPWLRPAKHSSQPFRRRACHGWGPDHQWTPSLRFSKATLHIAMQSLSSAPALYFCGVGSCSHHLVIPIMPYFYLPASLPPSGVRLHNITCCCRRCTRNAKVAAAGAVAGIFRWHLLSAAQPSTSSVVLNRWAVPYSARTAQYC